MCHQHNKHAKLFLPCEGIAYSLYSCSWRILIVLVAATSYGCCRHTHIHTLTRCGLGVLAFACGSLASTVLACFVALSLQSACPASLYNVQVLTWPKPGWLLTEQMRSIHLCYLCVVTSRHSKHLHGMRWNRLCNRFGKIVQNVKSCLQLLYAVAILADLLLYISSSLRNAESAQAGSFQPAWTH